MVVWLLFLCGCAVGWGVVVRCGLCGCHFAVSVLTFCTMLPIDCRQTRFPQLLLNLNSDLDTFVPIKYFNIGDITSWSIYGYAIFTYNLPFSDLRYKWYSLRLERKCAKNSVFSPVLHSTEMSNGSIKYRRQRGESTHKIAYLIHKSTCGTANIQILNWGEWYGDSTSLHFWLAVPQGEHAPSTRI